MPHDAPSPGAPGDAPARGEVRWQAIIDGFSDPLLGVDRDRIIRYANAAVTRVLGHPVAELVARPFDVLLDPEEREEVGRQLDRALASPASAPALEHKVRRPDGRWELVEATPNVLADPTGRPFLVMHLRCVTERRRLEARLAQQQKMETLGRLASGVAHDFNNLITIILSYIDELLKPVEADAPTRREFAEEIRAAATRAADLTRQLLVFARHQGVAPVTSNLNDVVRGAEKMLRRILGEDVVLVVRLGASLRPARLDPGQIEQVILNLAVNSRDAMPRGGTLTIETQNAEVAPTGALPAPGAPPPGWVRLVITDTGTGMSDEVKAHLFEPFFTTKRPGYGTGLGLATVHGIVVHAGGHIEVDTALGRGTTFEISLPATEPSAGRDERIDRPLARSSQLLLVVEDDPQVRRATVRILESAGYRVLEAAGAAEALEVARRHAGALDLVVTDVVLSDESGPALAARLEQLRPGQRVLFVSGYTKEAVEGRGVVDGGLHFLAKPFTPPALLQRVQEVLDA